MAIGCAPAVSARVLQTLSLNPELTSPGAQALLRPGRFDRQISIDRPDITGREQIFCVYLEKLKLDKDMKHYSERMAALTPGAGCAAASASPGHDLSSCKGRSPR